MNHPILILVHNGRELTERCLQSALAQTIPTCVVLIDNDAPPGLSAWMQLQANASECVTYVRFSPQVGVSGGWNFGLKLLFQFPQVEHVLVVGNDTILPPTFYDQLLGYLGAGFVTGSETSSMEYAMDKESHSLPELLPYPDFSAFLIRRAVWEAVGKFDETMVHYCGDCDYHIRAHKLGVPLWKATDAVYYHERSSTLKNATGGEQAAIHGRANADRAAFAIKWGCLPGSGEYAEIFR